MNLKKIFKIFVGIKKKKKADRVLTSLNPDEKDNKVIKELFKKISSQEQQLSEISVKKKEKDLEKEEFLSDLRLVKELKEKSKRIESKGNKNFYELSKIYFYLKKYKNAKIDITDRDDEVVFDLFDNFGFVGDQFAIRGKSGKIWSLGKNLNYVIYKPESIRNHLKRKKIPIPYDKDLKPVPDLDKMLMGELKYDGEEDSFRESEEFVRPIRKIFQDKERKIYSLLKDKEYHESLIIQLTNNFKKLEREIEVHKLEAKVSNSGLSDALLSLRELSNQIGNTVRQNTLLVHGKLSSDEIIEKYEVVFKRLLDEMEDEKAKTAIRRAKDELHSDLQFTQKLDKKPIVVNVEGIKQEEINKN